MRFAYHNCEDAQLEKTELEQLYLRDMEEKDEMIKEMIKEKNDLETFATDTLGLLETFKREKEELASGNIKAVESKAETSKADSPNLDEAVVTFFCFFNLIGSNFL